MEAEDVLLWVVGTLIVGVVALMVYAAWSDATSPTIELQKSEWACAKRETNIVFVPMVVGKVTVTRPQPITQCVRWDRK